MSFMAGYLLGLEDSGGGQTATYDILEFVKTAEPIVTLELIPDYELKFFLIPEGVYQSYNTISNTKVISTTTSVYYTEYIMTKTRYIAVGLYKNGNLFGAFDNTGGRALQLNENQYRYHPPTSWSSAEPEKLGRLARYTSDRDITNFRFFSSSWSNSYSKYIVINYDYTRDWGMWEADGTEVANYHDVAMTNGTIQYTFNSILVGSSDFYTELSDEEKRKELLVLQNAMFNAYNNR